jgi:16S rRNA (uracil1498-N3)-methyltransferase
LLLRPPALLNSLLPLIQSGCPTFVATQGAPPYLWVLQKHMARVTQPGPSGKPLPCMLLVGPEGDFTGEEMDALLAAGAIPVGLGSNRLRVETAAMSMVDGASLLSESLDYAAEKDEGEPIAA